MSVPDEDGMTLGEIGRRLADVIAEIRGLRAELVRVDVYAANRAADLARLAAVETEHARDETERAALRRMVYGALLTTASGVVVAIVGVVLTLATKH